MEESSLRFFTVGFQRVFRICHLFVVNLSALAHTCFALLPVNVFEVEMKDPYHGTIFTV